MSDFSRNAWSVTKLTFARARFLAVFVIAGLIVGYWDTIKNYVDKWTRPAVAPDALAATSDIEYSCAMHPNIVRSEPGNCPICGMPLTKRKKGEKVRLPAGVVGRVQLTPERIALAGVGTSAIEPRKLVREIHAVGVLDYDESKVAQLSARVPGRVDELFIQYAGRPVKQDQKLYSIYSPEVYTAQREYLDARKRAAELAKAPGESLHDAEAVYKASMDKLRLWGMTGTQLRQLEDNFDKSGATPDHFTVTSPIDGIVVRKNIYEGGYVQAGDTPFVIANLDRLWLQAQIDEDDVPLVRVGEVAKITVDAMPNRDIRGEVTFVGFQLDPQRRTLTARIEVENPDHRLRPGMFAEARLRIPLGAGAASTRPTTAPIVMQMPVLSQQARAALTYGDALRSYTQAYEELVASRKDKVSPLLHEVLEKLGPVSDSADIKDEYTKLTEAVHKTMGQELPDLRETFKTISITMVNIGKKTGIPQDGPAIQETHCPMAHGTWLQEVGDIRNPYAPERMLTCGNAISNLPRVIIPKPTSRPALQAGESLAVPRSAVIDAGKLKVVFVVSKDEKGNPVDGVYDMRVVKLGPLASVKARPADAQGEYYPVIDGLYAGDQVVTQGAFLLDAENRINPMPIDTTPEPTTRPTTQPTTVPVEHQH